MIGIAIVFSVQLILVVAAERDLVSVSAAHEVVRLDLFPQCVGGEIGALSRSLFATVAGPPQFQLSLIIEQKREI
jgi:hypothetical protein